MGSYYFGEPNLGNERSGSSTSTSSSSRKSKKGNSDKPKQPQRGLGVAQLEKIRLHSQMGTSCAYLPASLQTPYPTTLNQLEDMRLQTAYSSVPSSSSLRYSSSPTSSFGFQGHQNIMMGLGEFERGNIVYGDSQPNSTASWIPKNDILENQHFAQPSMNTRHLLNLQVEDSMQKKRKKYRSGSIGSSSQNSESSDTQELDLELRLSI